MQFCSAVRILYDATDGVAPDSVIDHRNRLYLEEMERSLEFTVYTGWRTWPNRATTDPISWADSEPFIFSYSYWQPTDQSPIIDESP